MATSWIYSNTQDRSRYIMPRGSGGSSGGTPPDGVANLIGWWDPYTHATYDATPELTLITDQGPNNWDLVPDVVGASQVTYVINGVASPMPQVVAFRDVPEIDGLAESVGDFTLMFLIPTGKTHANNTCYFATKTTAGGFWDIQLTQSSTSSAIDFTGNGSLPTSFVMDVGFDNAAPDAYAILFLRRGAGGLTCDCWYDKFLGAGVVNPAQQTGADVFPATLSISGFALGGRGSITQSWVGSPFDMAAMWDRELTDSEILSLAQWAGVRLGITGIV